MIFGDGAGAVVLQPTEDDESRNSSVLIYTVMAKTLKYWRCIIRVHMPIIGRKKQLADFDEAEMGEMFMSHAMMDKAQLFS